MRETFVTGGRIIYLNGASSAGKTSIGRELQGMLDEPHLLLGIDTFIDMMPDRLFGVEDGMRFLPSNSGGLTPVAGTAAELVFGAMYQAVSTLARAGNHIIFDDVMTSAARLGNLVGAWHGNDVLLVGIRCDEALVVAREQARGDRAVGLARGTSAVAHVHMEYDIEVDSGAMSTRQCADAIQDFLLARPLTAFVRLGQRMEL